MVVCPVCGTKNLPTANFCTNCNTYLGWDRDPQSQQGEDSANEQHASARQQPPLIPQPDDPVAQQAGALVASQPDPHPTRRPRRPTTAEVPRPASAEGNGTTQVETRTGDAVHTGAGTAEIPTPVLPARPASEPVTSAPAELVKPGAPQPVKPGERLFVPTPAAPPPVDLPAPGDLICRNCGTGNDPHRTFCRRCAHTLAEPVVAPRLSWWRRVFGPHPRAVRPAGSRPRRPLRFPTRTVTLLVILALGGGGWYAYRDAIGRAITRVQDEVGAIRVEPASSLGSDSGVAYGPGLTHDGCLGTAWVTDGAGDYLDVTFAEPIRLVAVGVTLGPPIRTSEWVAEGRPLQLRLVPNPDEGPGDPWVVDLKDTPGFQKFYVGVDGVKVLRIQIVSVRPSESPGRVAIDEVEYLAGPGPAPDMTQCPSPAP